MARTVDPSTASSLSPSLMKVWVSIDWVTLMAYGMWMPLRLSSKNYVSILRSGFLIISIIEINWWISIKPVNHLQQSESSGLKANNFPIKNCSPTIRFRAIEGVIPILLIYLRRILIYILALSYWIILYFSRIAQQLRGLRAREGLDRLAAEVKISELMSYLLQKYWQARTWASRFGWWRLNTQIPN